MGRVLLGVFSLLLTAGLLAGGAYLWFDAAVGAPGALTAPTTVIIPPGSGTHTIARQLADAGVIRTPWMFELQARRAGVARGLKPGEFRFDAQVSLTGALTKIAKRDVVARFVTIPEGLITADITSVLAGAEGLQGDAVSSGGAIHDGDLLPETYRYEWGDSRASIVARMRAAHDAAVAELWSGRGSGVPLTTPAQAVVLASIVEKETALPDERPRIAAVFLNRLRRGMRLQSDPTVIYGIAPQGLPRSLMRADLEHPTPFNTYTIDGLPPSPICHPGRAALAAALHPAAVEDLYFVADGSGGHAFAATLDQHNRNVAQWRRHERENSPEE